MTKKEILIIQANELLIKIVKSRKELKSLLITTTDVGLVKKGKTIPAGGLARTGRICRRKRR